MKKYFIFQALIILFTVNTFAQKVTIEGTAKTYIGDSLKFYTYEDYIGMNKKFVGKSVVDSNGNFKFEIKTKKTIRIYLDLKVFIGRMYIEPDSSYKIYLPVKQKMLEADKMNPYFEPEDFYIGIDTPKYELNYKIKKFNVYFAKSVKKLFRAYKGEINPDSTEKEIKLITDSCINDSNKFFLDYTKYKILVLRYLAYKKDDDFVLKNFFSDSILLHNNPAFQDAFKLIFKKYIFDKKLPALNNKITENITWRSFNEYIASSTKLKKTEFRELLIVYNLYNYFYRNKKNKKEILRMFKNIELQSEYKLIREIASNFTGKNSLLLENTIAPNFTLTDRFGKEKSLSDFRGNFVYLNFCSPESYPCFRELDLLSAIHKKKNDKLKIITIWKGENYEKMNNFMRKHKYNWTFLLCFEDDEVLKDYNIHAYPTYFIINPEGELLQLTAPGPANGFNDTYFKLFMKWKRDQINKRNK